MANQENFGAGASGGMDWRTNVSPTHLRQLENATPNTYLQQAGGLFIRAGVPIEEALKWVEQASRYAGTSTPAASSGGT